MHLSSFFTMNNTFVIITILIFTSRANAERVPRRRARACPKVEIPNAEVSYKSNYKIMRINCVSGYVLYGGSYVLCEMGKWNSALPVCAKGGCTDLESPPNGDIMYNKRQQAHLYCRANYNLAGGRVTYCNGTSWDRPLGTCREVANKTQLSCDFETEDLCGWSHDETHDFDWKRIMAANIFSKFRTGPQHDHTTLSANAGHYMLMESFDQVSSSVARLSSPIYPKNLTINAACFRFYYFMYGASVGNLSVYIRPISVHSDNLVQLKNNQINPTYRHFFKSGNQKNAWIEGQFKIEEMSEDFQIIIEGTTGFNHLSDIAIDDVQLLTYAECYGYQTSESSPVSEVTEIAIYDVQSCKGRCGETNITHYGITEVNGKFYKTCDCHSECDELKSCCPNYQTVCEYESSTEISDAKTTANSAESDTAPTISVAPVVKSTATTLRATTTKATTTTTTTTSTTTKTTTTPKTTTNTTTTMKSTSPLTTSTLSPRPISTTGKTTKPKNITISTPLMTVNSTTTIRSTTTTTATPNVTKMSMATTSLQDPVKVQTIEENPESKSEDATETQDSTQRVKTERPILNTNGFTEQETIMSWEVTHKNKPSSKSPSLLILTATVIGITIIIAFGVAIKCHRAYKKLRIYKRRRVSTDTTTLLYSQGDELIIES